MFGVGVGASVAVAFRVPLPCRTFLSADYCPQKAKRKKTGGKIRLVVILTLPPTPEGRRAVPKESEDSRAADDITVLCASLPQPCYV
jgi:hypothetical protein